MEQAKGVLSQAGGAIQEGAGKVGDAASAGLEQARAGIDSPQLKKLLPYLLAGGAGAAAGGIMSGRRKKRSGETRGQYLTRVLRNAAVTGGLVGGGSYLAAEGFKKTIGAADLENPLTGKDGDQGPLASGLRDVAFHPATAAAAGLGTLGATINSKTLGANPLAGERETQMLADLKGRGVKGVASKADLVGLGRKDPAAFKAALGTDPSTLRDARSAGVNIHAPGTLAHTTTSLAKPISNLMGRTTGRRIGRGALGAGAALLPALLGALTTDAPA